ncbi:MAG: Xaa-Pro peptidase family protein [Candidatus Syntrophoarchaeum sp.]|nr:Xaa-Pro peptidase family protein [Candidatus Syntrophoarchaeum sp.]
MSQDNNWMLFFADSISNQNMYYLTHFLTQDPFIYLGDGNQNEILLTSELEINRAKKESRIADVRSFADYADSNSHNIVSVMIRLLREENITTVKVEKNFPIYLADKLRSNSIELVIADLLGERRAVKRSDEIRMIKMVQQATTSAMQAAIDLIKSSKMKKGFLTSAMVKQKILHSLIDHGCESEEPIVACGKDSANPHSTGSGKLLMDQPIVIDIFPRGIRNRYYADMTRTVVVGEPSRDILEIYDAVLDAQEEAIGMVKAGVNAADIHAAVNDKFEAQGYGTLRTKAKSGFIHSTGHGVGLSLHELPNIGDKDYILKAGNVITIEPGLYIPAVGGVRIEDLILVKRNGFENLTAFPKERIVI